MIVCSPSPAASVPCTRPRRALRSPITSPWYASGTVTSSSETGSSRTGAGLGHRLAEAERAGHLEAHLRAVDRVELAVEERRPARRPPGSRRRRPSHIVSAMPFSTAGMNCFGIAPPTILSTNSKPAPRSSGSTRRTRDAELAVAAGLLLVLALGLGRAGDRLAVRRPSPRRSRPRRRTCGAAARRRSPGASRPCPTAASGASRRRAARTAPDPRPAAGAAPSSACPRRPWTSGGSRSTAPARAARAAGSRTGVPFGASVSPVVVSPSLATAAMSPAGTSGSGSCSLPRSVKSACSFSSLCVRGLVSTASGRIVPDSTLKIETLPT